MFVAQEAHFLAAVQVIVYAGAIVVLFLFVIMLLGVDKAEDLQVEPFRCSARSPRSSAPACSALIVAGDHRRRATPTGRRSGAERRRRTPRPMTRTTATSAQLARDLFSDHVLAFELTSVLLVIAVVGTVLLARRPPRSRPTEAPS